MLKQLEHHFFLLVMVVFAIVTFTSNPVFAAPARKGEDPRIMDKAFAEAAGLVCGSGFNKTPAVGNYAVGDSFCIGELPLGKTISQSPGFGPGSKGEESLVDFLSEIPDDSDLIIGCFNDEVAVVGCQNALSGKANACNTGMAAARCQNAFNLAIQANPGLFGRTTQVLSSIKGVRQVVFLVKKRPVAPAPASGSERCTADEVAAAAKIKLAGDHTEAFKARVVVMIEGQRLPAGVMERVVTLTIPGYDETGKGFIVRHPEQVKSCRVGLVSAGSLPPNPPDVQDTPPDPPGGYPKELQPAPTPAPAERETNCTDGVDNDDDGKIDCADSDCREHAAVCQPQDEICDDGRDNDRDGFTDKDDSDCLKRPDPPSKINLVAYIMGYQERPPREEFKNMEDPGLRWKDYFNFQMGLGVPFHVGKDVVLVPSFVVATRTTQYTAEETVGPLLGDKHAWVVGGEISLLKKVGKTLWAGVEPGFYYGSSGVDPYLNGKIQYMLTPRVGVAVVFGVRVVKNHLTEEAVFIPRLGFQLSFSLDPIFQ